MHRLHCEHIHAHIHTVLSYHPVGIQLLLVSAADKTGGFSFVLIRASKERSCPDGSVHQLFSLVPFPQLVWLEPLSLCALNLVHMNDVREEARDSSNPDRSRKTRRTCEWLNQPFPLYHTYILLLWNPRVDCFNHIHRPPLALGYLTCIKSVALNSTVDLSQWREAKWLAWNAPWKNKTEQNENFEK